MKVPALFLLAIMTLFISACSGDSLIDERFLTKNYNIQSQELDLSDMSLTTVPDFNEFGTGSDFFSAKILNLSDNNIEFLNSFSLSNFSELKTILLNNNDIKVLRNLKIDTDTLDLSQNEIEVLNFSAGSVVKTLKLSDNNFRFGADIEDLPTAITRLELKNNDLENLDGIGALLKLEYLDVSFNNLADIDMKELIKQKGLKFLNLSENPKMSKERIEAMEKYNKIYLEKQNVKAKTKPTLTGTGSE